jgi:pimeloyl-ACP methyl ester carboxylesterase
VDPCDYSKGFADVNGTSVDALRAALRNVPGLQLTDLVTASIGGYHGIALVLTAPASLAGCTLSPEGYVLWQNPLGGLSPGLAAGESIRVWILDVAGKRLVIVIQDAGYTSAQRAETQTVFDSIRIEPAN